MKKSICIVLICSFCISCKKMLIEKPTDRISGLNFYKTKADAVAAVNAIYDPLNTNFGDRYGVQFTALSDYGSGFGFIAAFVTYNSPYPATTDVQFQAFFRGINNANVCLKYIPSIEMPEADKNALLGEASFLRALCYRNLVRSWGAVPLRVKPIEATAETGGKRVPAAEITALIIKDLEYAETTLPATQTLAGKPTKWSAKTMLADIYLQNEKWAEARDKANEVISSGAYSLVPVSRATDFENIFGPTAITSTEDIFSIKFSRISGSNFTKFFHLPASTYASGGYGSIFGNRNSSLIKNWDKNDLRSVFDIYTSYTNKAGQIVQNTAAEPYRFGKFKDPGFAPGMGNDYPVYRYPDALLIYAEAASQANGAPTALALERLNMVHRRAYGYPSNVPASVDFTLAQAPTATAFRDLVLRERAYEFLCEDGKRWFDLVRTKTVKQVIKSEKNIDVPDWFLLLPIPVQEIDSNPDISPQDQNAGY